MEGRMIVVTPSEDANLGRPAWRNSDIGRHLIAMQAEKKLTPSELVALDMVINSKAPQFMHFGPELNCYYNDAFLVEVERAVSLRHPELLGLPARKAFPDLGAQRLDMLDSVYFEGKSFEFADTPVPLHNKNGPMEEAYYTFSWTPMYDGDKLMGIFNTVTNRTVAVQNQRYLNMMSVLRADTTPAQSIQAACEKAIACMNSNPWDCPLAALYLRSADTSTLLRRGVIGLENPEDMPASIDLNHVQSVWGEVVREGTSRNQIALVDVWEGPALAFLSQVVLAEGRKQPRQLAGVPIRIPGQEMCQGVILVGLNPLRPLESAYRGMLLELADRLSISLADVMLRERHLMHMLTTWRASGVGRQLLDGNVGQLGPVSQWPQTLLHAMDVALGTRQPISITWGDQFLFLPNDALIALAPNVGSLADLAGQPMSVAFPQLWRALGASQTRVFNSGQAVSEEQHLMALPGPYGADLQERYWTLGTSPLRADDGSLCGTQTTMFDITARVQGERRLHTLSQLSVNANMLTTVTDAANAVLSALGGNERDFLAFRLFVADEKGQLRDSQTGEAILSPSEQGDAHSEGGVYRALAEFGKQPDESGKLLEDLSLFPAHVRSIAVAPTGAHPTHCKLLQLRPPGHTSSVGVLAVVVNPMRQLPGDYRNFLRLAATQAAAAIKGAQEREAEIQRTERERSLRLEAEQANRSKERFLAVLSHELRTPLTPALLVAGMLAKDDELPLVVRENADSIVQCIQLQQRMVDDLLDMSKLLHGKMSLSITDGVDMRDVLFRTQRLLSLQAESRGVAIAYEMPDASDSPSERLWVRGDSVRLAQVFLNIAGNAIKFTNSGGRVFVRGFLDQAAGAGGGEVTQRVVVEVRDTGQGMAPELLQRLFLPFQQGEHVKFAGLGLGLFLARSILDLHGGTLTATSDGPGLGSCFTVTLPFAPPTQPSLSPALLESSTVAEFQQQQQQQEKQADEMPLSLLGKVHPRSASMDASAMLPHLRVMLVEDNNMTRKIMQRMLSQLGYTVAQTADCYRQAAGCSLDFDVLLSDMGLPDGDGCQVLRSLRARGFAGPAVAVTGYGQESDFQRTKEAGFMRHLVKPVDVDTLRRAIEEVAAPSQPPVAATEYQRSILKFARKS